MPKVSFIGDSIRIQYVPRVSELLGEDFEVFSPKENSRFAKYTLRSLFDMRGEMDGSSIVHWNNGLWDICDLFGDGLFTSEDEYVNNMTRIADILTERYDKVIFATTTPVSEKNIYNKNADIQRYNELIVPILKEKGIIINDLFSLVSSDIGRYISNDNIHLTEAGIELCAVEVSDVIKREAKGLAQNKNVSTVPRLDNDGAPIIFN